MSLLQRITAATRATHLSVQPVHPGDMPRVPTDSLPGLRCKEGPFASLVTTPAHLADDAYEAFANNTLTPGVAERQVAQILSGCEAPPRCAELEKMLAFTWDHGREATDSGRRRILARYLVRMQLLHDTNAVALRRMRHNHIRRAQVLPGCCDVCDRAVSGRTFRTADPPHLPVSGCVRHGGCTCTFTPVVS